MFGDNADIRLEDMSTEVAKTVDEISRLHPEEVVPEIARLATLIVEDSLSPSERSPAAVPPKLAVSAPLTAAGEDIAQHLRASYFSAIPAASPGDAEQTQLLEERLTAAAHAFESVGCTGADDVEVLLKKIRIHDTLARLLGGSVAGGTGYALGFMTFTEKIAAYLGPDVSPAKLGLYAGLFVGMLDSVMAPMAGAVTQNHVIGSTGPSGIDAIDNIQPSLLKTALVAASSNTGYSTVKNMSRIIAPYLVRAPLDRLATANLDRALDIGGIYISSSFAKEHTRRILRGNQTIEMAKFLAQPDLQKRLQDFRQPLSLSTAGKALVGDFKAMGSAASKAVSSPSSYLIAMYIGGMISALLNNKSLVTAHHASTGLAADEITRAEAAALGATSTAMMAGLAFGATIIGVTTAATLDGHVKKLWENGVAALANLVRNPQPDNPIRTRRSGV